MPQKIDILAAAPDFELTDTRGHVLNLSELWQEKYVVLVLLRGFV